MLTPKGIELMEEAFQNVNVQDFKVHLAENNDHHTAIVSKKSTSEREYTVIIPKTDTLGSRFGKCTHGFPKKEGIPCHHMVAVFKLGRIDGLTRTAVMPHWYTTAQWCNQFPENTYIDTHQTLKLIKANSTPMMMNYVTDQTGWGPRRRVIRRRISTGRVLLTILSNQHRRSAGQLNPPKHHRRRELIWKGRT
jgi:hypothetical protein